MKNAALALMLASSLALAQTPPSRYTVQSGDTLSAISRQFGVSVADLRALNSLPSDTLQPGQVLLLQKPASSVAAPSAAPSSVPQTQTQRLGTVELTAPTRLKPGDAFGLRFKGEGANRVTVRFPTESGEDVRQPGETLRPIAVNASSSVVLGRVVLGAVSGRVDYEVRLDDKLITGKIALELPPRPRVDSLLVPQSVLDAETPAAVKRETDALEGAYARRTPQAWKEPFLAPIDSVVTSPFGSARVYKKGGKVNYHYGTDLRAALGTPIRAANAGTVIVADFYATRGGLTVIDHGMGVVSAYFHQSKILVKPGDVVSRGQVIGQVGSTGYALGPHLHWEMRVRGEATDPWDWAGKMYP